MIWDGWEKIGALACGSSFPQLSIFRLLASSALAPSLGKRQFSRWSSCLSPSFSPPVPCYSSWFPGRLIMRWSIYFILPCCLILLCYSVLCFMSGVLLGLWPPWHQARRTGVALWAPSTCFFPTSLLSFVLYDDTLNDVIFPTLLCLGEEEDTNN